MTVADIIRRKLAAAFDPVHLEVKDESFLHRGHAGASAAGESHFRILVVSEQFEGQGALARQRAVNRALSDELAGPVHALAMRTASPAEWARLAAGYEASGAVRRPDRPSEDG